MAPIGVEAVEDLRGKFARGTEHQHAAALAFARQGMGGETMQDRQREGGGLAGAGLRDADDVASAECDGDGLGLDRGWSERIFLRAMHG